MTAGNTTTSALADSLPSVIASARIVREMEGVMAQLVDKVTLGEGIGLTWNEISLAALTATTVTENQELDNPQQLSDSLFSITPTVVAIHTVITDRVARRISKNAFAKTGSLAQNAIQRKKDQDLLVLLDGATTSLCGAGSTLSQGHVGAAVSRISSNTTEPGRPPYRCVLHGYQIKDIADELLSGLGTQPVPEGPTARVFKENFRGQCRGAMVYEDGNIAIDSAADAKGGVFARDGIVLVQGKMPWVKTIRNEKLGGGATEVLHYDEYAAGERSAGNWVYELYSDSTAPTS